jgi:hypothetical protein
MKRYKITYNVEEVNAEVKFQAVFITEGKDEVSAEQKCWEDQIWTAFCLKEYTFEYQSIERIK